MLAGTVAIASMVLLGLLLARAIRGKFVARYPFFYFYAGYMLLWTIVTLGALFFLPQHYASIYWFAYLLSQLLEFAVLVEVSDHIFEPYAAIRHLGRGLFAVLCGLFLMFYIMPALFRNAPSSQVWLDLIKAMSLTKAVIIVFLLGAARVYRLRLGRNLKGILLGFSLYLGFSIADSQFALTLGRTVYSPIYRESGPLVLTLAAALWTAALWDYRPVIATGAQGRLASRRDFGTLENTLDRINNTLVKLLER